MRQFQPPPGHWTWTPAEPERPRYTVGDYLWLAFSIVTLVAVLAWNTVQLFVR